MAPQEIKKLLDQKPFHPLRIHMVDGSEFEVHEREQAALTLLTLHIHFDPDDESGLYSRTEYLSPSHVVRVVPFDFGSIEEPAKERG